MHTSQAMDDVPAMNDKHFELFLGVWKRLFEDGTLSSRYAGLAIDDSEESLYELMAFECFRQVRATLKDIDELLRFDTYVMTHWKSKLPKLDSILFTHYYYSYLPVAEA